MQLHGVGMMPLYDCGDKDCEECQRAFGPNREKAIKRFEARETFYAALPQPYTVPSRECK